MQILHLIRRIKDKISILSLRGKLEELYQISECNNAITPSDKHHEDEGNLQLDTFFSIQSYSNFSFSWLMQIVAICLISLKISIMLPSIFNYLSCASFDVLFLYCSSLLLKVYLLILFSNTIRL